MESTQEKSSRNHRTTKMLEGYASIAEKHGGLEGLPQKILSEHTLYNAPLHNRKQVCFNGMGS